MAFVQLPSVQVDLVTEDVLNATKATLTGTEAGPFDLGSGGTFTITVDGGSAQTISFEGAQFLLLEAATLAEIIAAINTQVTGAIATAASGGIVLESDTYGAASSLLVSDGTLAIVTLLGIGSGSSASDTGTDADDVAVLINRNPEPDESAVPADSTIYFELASTDGTAPDEADMTVLVGGVTVWDGATWLASYTGTWSNPAVDVVAATITPPSELTTTEVVTVRVTCTSPTFDESYTFTAEDTAPPEILSVQGRDEKILRLTFTEPVIISSTSATNDALNPTNYLIERISRPAVSVEVESVNQVSDRVVDLTTDIELTYGAPYMLVVKNVEDFEGNAILAPNNTANFNAYTPPFPTGRRYRLIEFLPEMNRSEDANQDLSVFIGIFQEVVNLLLVSTDKWSQILDIDQAPDDVLEAMLADLGNPFEEFDLDETDKRRLLYVLVEIYKLKGTGVGIINVVRFFLGIEVTITVINDYTGWELTEAGADSSIGNELSDYFDDAPDPADLGPDESGIYSFIVHSPYAILTTEERERITSIAEFMKPAHTHLISVTDITPEEGIDHAEIGYSTLGSSTPGEGTGTFMLHE